MENLLKKFNDLPVVGRDHIAAIEAAMKEMPQAEVPIKHYFADNLYAREIHIPRGTMLTGQIHKTTHINIISKGKIAIAEEGRDVQILEAPCTIVSKPGTKRLGIVLEDTVWTTLHGTPERDLDKLESMLVAKDFSELEGPDQAPAIEHKTDEEQPWLG